MARVLVLSAPSYLNHRDHLVCHNATLWFLHGPKRGVDCGHSTHVGSQFRAKFRAEYVPPCKNHVPRGFFVQKPCGTRWSGWAIGLPPCRVGLLLVLSASSLFLGLIFFSASLLVACIALAGARRWLRRTGAVRLRLKSSQRALTAHSPLTRCNTRRSLTTHRPL